MWRLTLNRLRQVIFCFTNIFIHVLSTVNLQVLYKLKTAKLFEKPRLRNPTGSNQQENTNNESDDPFAIEQVSFCPESRYLAVAGASSQVIVFRFCKQEAQTDLPVS